MVKLSLQQLIQIIIIISLVIFLIWNYRSCPTKFQSTFNDDCSTSLAESDGMFCESDSLWNERKTVYHSQDKENMIIRPNTIYLAANWEPNFHCSHAQRIGAMGDGGKWICDPYKLKSRHDCLIYSVGSSGDFSFEIAMKKLMPDCEIHTFDKGLYPCPIGVCIFHQIMFGTGIESNISKSWPIVIKELNHMNRFIDILKIDIEGGEYSFFPLIFASNRQSWPRQIVVEIHPTNVTLVHKLFYLLRDNNYAIFKKEANLEGGPYFAEYGFLRLNQRFFK